MKNKKVGLRNKLMADVVEAWGGEVRQEESQNMILEDMRDAARDVVENVGNGFSADIAANNLTYYTPRIARQSKFDTITSATTSQIAGGITLGDDDPTKYSLNGSLREWLTTSAGFKVSRSPDKNIVMATTRSFLYTGSQIEFRLRQLTSSATVFIDGELAVEFNIGNANAPYYYHMDFTDALTRRIDIVTKFEYWGGLVIEPNSTVVAVDDATTKVAVMGDSFTGGTGSVYAQNWSNLLGMILKGLNVFSFGVGGSGYVNDTATGKFINRLDELMLSDPDYVITAGGLNDLNLGYNDFTQAVDDYYADLLTRVTKDQIIIVGTWYPSNPIATTIQFNDYLKAKADEIGVKFIDPITEPWVTGTGTVTDQQGDGNADLYTGDDGTHPTPDGHVFLGRKVSNEMLKF